jgi:hypothetical protein
MKAVTQKFNIKGAFVEASSEINIGQVVVASSKRPQLIALFVEDVAYASGISLDIVSSQNIDVSQGFLQYYTSKDILTSFDHIVKKTVDFSSPISVGNLTDTTSEYVYLWIDNSKVLSLGDAVIRLEWNFDYIEESSSS